MKDSLSCKCCNRWRVLNDVLRRSPSSHCVSFHSQFFSHSLSFSLPVSLSPSLFFPPPPPPNTIKTANEGRFRLNVDSPYGERAQSTVLTRAPPRRPARPRRDFIFNLSMRESKASPVVVCSPCRRKKALSTRCQLICWPLLPTFLGGLVTQPNKGRTSPWQMPAGQAGAANISWSASAGRR